MPRVVIQGEGVAARCSGLLLSRAGFGISTVSSGRPPLPAIMLSEAAVSLMRDVFGQPNLFLNSTRILRRIVQWGPDSEPRTLDHSAVVVSEQELLADLGALPSESGAADWTVCASRPLPADVAEYRFGGRSATAFPVDLTSEAEPAACWMESLDAGWLFLITNQPGKGWLLSVGDSALTRSRLIAPLIARCGQTTGTFSSSPRIVAPLTGPNWLACGTAALTFDPICGDGTANAVREAILAAAVIEGIANGGDAPSLRAHYESRLTAGFRRHLEMCLAFYRSGGAGDWWRSEAEALRTGVAFCDAQNSPNPAFQYRLNGFRLEAL